MVIEPNSPIDYVQECVLCADGAVITHDDRRTPLTELENETSGFKQLCRSMDPNKGFIVGFVPNDADRPVFFKAREVARSIGLHMQANVEEPDEQRRQWETHKLMRRMETIQSAKQEDQPGAPPV
jgi:hypothetical protein